MTIDTSAANGRLRTTLTLLAPVRRLSSDPGTIGKGAHGDKRRSSHHPCSDARSDGDVVPAIQGRGQGSGPEDYCFTVRPSSRSQGFTRLTEKIRFSWRIPIEASEAILAQRLYSSDA